MAPRYTGIILNLILPQLLFFSGGKKKKTRIDFMGYTPNGGDASPGLLCPRGIWLFSPLKTKQNKLIGRTDLRKQETKKTYSIYSQDLGFPGGASGKEPTCQSRWRQRREFNPWGGKIPWRRAWQPTLVFMPRESHGQRSLAGCSPQGCKESDSTEVS